MARINDLGNDRIGSLLMRLAMPAIFAQMVNALYSVVNRVYLGHIADIGPLALTGVGVTFPVTIVIAAFGILIGMGAPPLAAIAMGAGQHEKADKILGNALTASLILAVLLTLWAFLGADPLLRLFGASDETLPYALNYLHIYLCGTVFLMVGMGLNGFLAAQGFATTAMLTSVLGAVLNIVLDPIFIFGFGWGVRGAALGSVIAQAASATWIVLFLRGKKTRLRLRRDTLPIDWRVLRPVLALGISPFVMVTSDSLVAASFNASLFAYGGNLAVGAMTVCMAVVQIGFMPLFGVAQGAQPIISFNYGARKMDRVRETFRLLLYVSMGYAACLWLVIELLPRALACIFTGDTALIDLTAIALRVSMAMVFLMGIQFPCQQTLVALNQSKLSLLLSLLRKVVLLIPLVFLLPHILDDKVFAVFLALPVADFFSVCVTARVFRKRFPRILDARQNATGDNAES